MEFWTGESQVRALEDRLRWVLVDLAFECWTEAAENATEVAASLDTTRAVEKKAWSLVWYAGTRLGRPDLVRQSSGQIALVRNKTTGLDGLFAPARVTSLEHGWADVLRGYPGELRDVPHWQENEPRHSLDAAWMMLLFGELARAADYVKHAARTTRPGTPEFREAHLFRALLALRDGRPDEARAIVLRDRDRAALTRARPCWLDGFGYRIESAITG